jgi:hypothetical protein
MEEADHLACPYHCGISILALLHLFWCGGGGQWRPFAAVIGSTTLGGDIHTCSLLSWLQACRLWPGDSEWQSHGDGLEWEDLGSCAGRCLMGGGAILGLVWVPPSVVVLESIELGGCCSSWRHGCDIGRHRASSKTSNIFEIQKNCVEGPLSKSKTLVVPSVGGMVGQPG